MGLSPSLISMAFSCMHNPVFASGFHSQYSLPYSMYLIPTSMSPLIRVCIGGDNLLLIYGDCHARLWDVKTQEFWRAMTIDKAGELVGQGGWAEWLAYLIEYVLFSQ